MSLQPFPPKILIVALVLALAGCQPGSGAHPVPSVAQIGADLKCSPGDHPFEDPQLGWGFCYPKTWEYIERAQALSAPRGVDLTFDFTCLSACRSETPDATGNNLFAYMIVSTYDRSGAADLAGWASANLKPPPAQLQPLSWGNAREAATLPDGRRIGLTPQFVVILDVRSGTLDLEGEMALRLDTWKFSV
jgi:hypothetical protein